jgi:hypothetical protein
MTIFEIFPRWGPEGQYLGPAPNHPIMLWLNCNQNFGSPANEVIMASENGPVEFRCPICEGSKWIVWEGVYSWDRMSWIASPYRPFHAGEDTAARIAAKELFGPILCPKCQDRQEHQVPVVKEE